MPSTRKALHRWPLLRLKPSEPRRPPDRHTKRAAEAARSYRVSKGAPHVVGPRLTRSGPGWFARNGSPSRPSRAPSGSQAPPRPAIPLPAIQAHDSGKANDSTPCRRAPSHDGLGSWFNPSRDGLMRASPQPEEGQDGQNDDDQPDDVD